MDKESKMKLPKITVDDLFTTQEERDSLKQEKVINISIRDIEDFPNHPFKVVVNEDLQKMVDSIKESGVISPVLVREKSDGKYEMIAGHRRKKASELANLDTLPCIIRNLTDDEAILYMVDSNLQREKILPSEKAYAYKMKLEAISRQGQRNDLTSYPMDTKLDTANLVGKENDDSRATVFRYIRLTYLIPEIIEMVDIEKIAFRPAVELSYLTEEEQYTLLDTMEYSDCTPSLAQAIHLKKLSQEKSLTAEKIEGLLEQEKPNQTPKVKISGNRLKELLPRNLTTEKQIEDFVISCVEEHIKRQKQRQMDER